MTRQVGWDRMNRTPRARELMIFADERGREPFVDWFESLAQETRRRVQSRFARVRQGNFGDCEPVGNGVYELRLMFGSGHRIYFAEDGDSIILLLCGGDKSSQRRDIQRAKYYWREYQGRGR